MMRKLVTLALGSTAVVAMACGRSKSNDAAALNDDLKRDLQLATQSQAIQISPDEISPRSHQEMAVRPKKAPDGPRTVRSDHPTRKASPRPVEQAPVETQLPQVQVLASSSPAPSETPSADSPPLARPAPMPEPSYPSTARIPDQGPSGVGAVLGGILGAVIRGGVVGDDDHCDPRPRRNGGPIRGSIPVGIGRSPIFGGGRRY